MDQVDMLVIGSGPAGRRAAMQSAKLGKSVLVVERGRRVGGVSVHTGTIPSKTLRETVLNLSGWRERGFYGLAYRVKKDIDGRRSRRRGCARRSTTRSRCCEHQFARNWRRSAYAEARFVSTRNERRADHRRRRDQPRRLRARADRRRHAAAPAGQRAVRRHARLRQRRDPRRSALPRSLTVVGARRDRHRIRDDLLGARRAGHADRAARHHPRFHRPRDHRRLRPPDARPRHADAARRRRSAEIDLDASAGVEVDPEGRPPGPVANAALRRRAGPATSTR